MCLVFNYILDIEISTQTNLIFFSQGIEALPTRGSEGAISDADSPWFREQKHFACGENEHYNNTRQNCEEYCHGRNGRTCFMVRFFFTAIATDQVCVLLSQVISKNKSIEIKVLKIR